MKWLISLHDFGKYGVSVTVECDQCRVKVGAKFGASHVRCPMCAHTVTIPNEQAFLDARAWGHTIVNDGAWILRCVDASVSRFEMTWAEF